MLVLVEKGKSFQYWRGGNDIDYRITIDYSEGQSELSGTEKSGYIIFRDSLDQSRLNGIRSIVLTSFTTGQVINTYSHSEDCSNATQISVWKK